MKILSDAKNEALAVQENREFSLRSLRLCERSLFFPIPLQ
jgi:hypothetical protein